MWYLLFLKNNRFYLIGLQVSEQLDLLDLYIQKVFDKKVEEAMKVLTDLGNKTRTLIQTKLKSNDWMRFTRKLTDYIRARIT